MLAIVTGAPGAGKSAVAEALIAREAPFLVFDADWLLGAASNLAGGPIAETSELWPLYRRLWLTIAQMLARNGRDTILFMPVTPEEIVEALPASWRDEVRWELLDCDDETRRTRLAARGWPEATIRAAIDDGRELRGLDAFAIDTSRRTAEEVATKLAGWLGVSE